MTVSKNIRLPAGSVFTVVVFSVVFIAILLCAACSVSGDAYASDGYFTAESMEYDGHGWKEFVSIYINNGRIVTVEYNAKNASGFIKSWDMDYMRRMNAEDGTYPNKYTRTYSLALLKRQNPHNIDALSGATESWHSFTLLAEAVIKQAEKGDKKTAFVIIPEPGE
jgi:major membrane immunogen (membrane-anchored lipoprotein)